jgi:hypothetical protein
MSDRLRQLAAECMKLSEIGCDTTIQRGFRKLAEAYLKLANAFALSGPARPAFVGGPCGIPRARARTRRNCSGRLLLAGLLAHFESDVPSHASPEIR